MTWSTNLFKVWKWITADGSTLIVWYWQDFNPNEPTFPSWSSVWVYDETYSFNLSWFQPWHEVMTCMCWVEVNNTSWRMYLEALRSSDWTNWENAWYYWYMDIDSSWGSAAIWCWIWVDRDEIRPWYPYYKFHAYWNWYDDETQIVTISNLNIDSTDHQSWYMWVEWSHLCYVDASHHYWWAYYRDWFKHKIAYDWNFSEYVWTDYSWKIWIETDVIRRIYYVDQYWYKRRTYEARNWYWYTSWQWRSVWSSYKWKIYVSDWLTPSDWYAHLCFVNQNWYLLRMLNWPVWWVE